MTLAKPSFLITPASTPTLSLQLFQEVDANCEAASKSPFKPRAPSW